MDQKYSIKKKDVFIKGKNEHEIITVTLQAVSNHHLDRNTVEQIERVFDIQYRLDDYTLKPK